jgi:hypothetical protein
MKKEEMIWEDEFEDFELEDVPNSIDFEEDLSLK